MKRNAVVPGSDRPSSFVASRRIASSVFLQQLLYYNVFWSIAWLFAFGSRIMYRYGRGLSLVDPDIVRTVLTSFWLLAEPLRLAAGHYGNLQENVPVLFIFGVLTLAPQVPVCVYLLEIQRHLEAYYKALQTVMLMFLILEFLTVVYVVGTGGDQLGINLQPAV